MARISGISNWYQMYEQRQFHMFAIVVCTDFAFIFIALEKGVQNLFNITEYVVADAAKAIHNGFIETFGSDKTTIMCW